MIKNIIFDMDGVLINTEPVHYEIWKIITKENGISDFGFDIYKPCIGTSGNMLYDIIEKNYGVDFHGRDEIMDRFDEIKAEIVKTSGVPSVEGAAETLKYLHDNGYHMAVASSSSINEIRLEMKIMGFDKYFDLMVSSDSVKSPKPAPDVFLMAAKEAGFKTDETVVVEDSRNGTKAAKAAGMLCFGFKNPDSGDQDLSCADKVFYPFSRLKEMV